MAQLRIVLADRPGVRVARLLPPLALVAGAVTMALQWDMVIGAYRDGGQPATDIQLAGIDLAVEVTPLGPSPYRITPAPDTRAVDTAVHHDRPEIVAAPSVTGGEATLTGILQGPNGPAAGAVVRIERHTEGGLASLDVTTNHLGRWTAPRLLGGRYRVRAWQVGAATMDGSEVFFLPAGEVRTLPLTVAAVDTSPRMRYSRRGDIFVGLTGTVAVSVTVRTVDGDGFEVVDGLPGAVVALTPASPLVAVTSPAVTADGDGVARFVLTCLAAGTTSATVTHQDQTMTVDLPACVDPPPPPTLPPATLAPAAVPTPVTPAPAPTSPVPTTRPGATSRG